MDTKVIKNGKFKYGYNLEYLNQFGFKRYSAHVCRKLKLKNRIGAMWFGAIPTKKEDGK